MKYGVRDVVDVVLRAKGTMDLGNKRFYKNEPVLYFDTLTTSTLEGASTTVYAQGGKGNARLMAWEGERTVTFTMEDALISPEGFMILSGAGLVDASAEKPLYQHHVEQTDDFDAEAGTVKVSYKPYLPTDKKDNFAYIMLIKGGEIISEPYIPVHAAAEAGEDGKYVLTISGHENYGDPAASNFNDEVAGQYVHDGEIVFADELKRADAVLVDYYEEKVEGARQIEITPDKFGGNFYLEAETLFRTQEGVDLPAIFTIPNCKIQSNFTFTMASSGDPSTFNFVMDAFPDYTRFDHSKKVLATIQMFDTAGSLDLVRKATDHANDVSFDEKLFND